MPELDGPQIKVLRIGLLSAFVGPDAFDVFLSDELDKRLNFYAGAADPFPIAAFKLIEGAQAEGWIEELVVKAYRARPKNREIAGIAETLGITIDTSQLEYADRDQEAGPPLWQSLNPYRGLLALREQDANFLFGRDEDIARFVVTLAENPSRLFLALGTSGVGKSSLIFAGVFAALDRQSLRGGKPWPKRLSQSRTWPRLTLTPGPEPLRSLVGAFVRQWLDPREAKFREETNAWRELLLKGDSLDGLIEALDAFFLEEKGDKASRYLFYIDQGEELYTRGGREPSQDGARKETPLQKEARRFSELVAEAARHPRLLGIMSARSDFLGRLQADSHLHSVKQQIDIAPLAPNGVSEVVRRPAAALDVTFAPGLDEALVEATREQPGGLPLLSDTLAILWEEMQARGDGVLRWTRQVKDGVDVAAKLGERADGFVKAHQDQEALVRRLFCVRLAYVPSQGAATRRTAFDEELTDPERALVRELADPEQRILVTGEKDGKATAEVAHEALFTAWQSLRNWIISRRSFYAWKTQNEADRKDWEDQGKPNTALLTGRPLERAKSFLETDGEDVPAADRTFIKASIMADDEARRRARSIQAISYVLLLGVIASLGGIIEKEWISEQIHWVWTVRPYIATNIAPFRLTAKKEKALKPGDTFRECKERCPEMVVIPAGTFIMGSPDGEMSVVGLDGKPKPGPLAPKEEGRAANESPQHEVKIASAFAAGKYAMTFEEWDECVALGDCPSVSDFGYGRGRQPVINVSWDDAKKYVAWLSSMTGKNYRLLSEAEWEYAARAGTRTAYSFGDPYPPSKRICEYANFADVSYDRQAKRQGTTVNASNVCDDGHVVTAQVGSYKPNAFGLYDMHGNVFQWTEECYADSYEGASTDGSPTAIEDCRSRVARGGSWNDAPGNLRSACRFRLTPSVRSSDLGFRVGRTLKP